MSDVKMFNPLNVSSKFCLCGLPVRVDTYKTCTFGCKYCFSNNRKIMEFSKDLQVANLNQVIRVLKRVEGGSFDKESLLETLIASGVTWHCGGMSDPFQPIEQKYNVTSNLIDICNDHNIHILFSTKSDTVYGANIRPDLASFQLSVTNLDNRVDIEPNVPSIDKRIKFFNELKSDGFKVGIRIQPFIPGVTSLDVVKAFDGADNFTLEGLKIVPQNEEHKRYILDTLGLSREDFTQMGLLNLKYEIRKKLYEPFIEYFIEHHIPYSIADNDMHNLGTNLCCCGDNLTRNATRFNSTCLAHLYGAWTKEQVDAEILSAGVGCCKCNQLFTSNRQEGCESVQDFYDKRYYRKSSPFSPEFIKDLK